MAVPFTAGQRLTAADLNTATQQSAWTSYSTTWSSTGTAVSLGNGTLVSRYAKVGRLVSVRINLWGGSTTTWGTGSYAFTLPFAADVTSGVSGQFVHTGTILVAPAGNAAFYSPEAFVLQNTPSQVQGIVNASGTFWGAANPVSMGTTAQCHINITYESTS